MISDNKKYIIIKITGAIAAAPFMAWALDCFVYARPFWGFLLLYLAACTWGAVAAFLVFVVWPDRPDDGGL